MLKGIDISSWQADLNIGATDADFVIVKVTQATDYVNPLAKQQIETVLAQGKLLGLYHYAGGADPAREAAFFIENVGPYIGRAVLALDWEENQNMSFDQHVEWCKQFLRHVSNQTNVKPLLYMSASVVKMADWTPLKDEGYGLWVAGYPDLRDSWDVPEFNYDINPWKQATIWQYTSSNGMLDRDVFYGEAQAWKALATGSGSVEEPEINDRVHEMGLQNRFFNYIKDGTKRIELRLNDEKRQKIRIGDMVEFSNDSTGEKIQKKVVGLLRYDSFDDLFKDFSIRILGDRSMSKAELMQILCQFYTKEKQAQYGVVGIRLED